MTGDAALRVSLQGRLQIEGASRLRSRLLRALARRRPITLDAARVDHADTAALQILFAFVREASERGLPLRWNRVSDPLRQAAKQLGLAAAMKLPAAAVGE